MHGITVTWCTFFAGGFDQFEVESHFLSCLEWKNQTTDESRSVRVYKDAAPRWDRVALNLGFRPKQIQSIRHEPGDNQMKVFGEWFSNANSLPNKKRYPKKWSGLIRLLKDSDLGELSEEVKKALSAPYCDVRGNMD